MASPLADDQRQWQSMQAPAECLAGMVLLPLQAQAMSHGSRKTKSTWLTRHKRQQCIELDWMGYWFPGEVATPQGPVSDRSRHN